MRRLHRLLNDSQQLLAQLIQVNFLAQRSTEGSHDLCCIILATIEATINDILEALSQWLEEGRDGQRGDDDGDAAILADDAP